MGTKSSDRNASLVRMMARDMAMKPSMKKGHILAPYYACPVCGREIVPDYSFCPKCGQRIEWYEE